MHLYLTMPTPAGMTKLLTLWKKFTEGKPAPENQSRMWRLFDYLADIRGWSIEDRLDRAMVDQVKQLLTEDNSAPITIEIDLWYRTSESERDRSLATLMRVLQTEGGELLDLVTINEIRYQGALVRLPANIAAELIQGQGGLAHLDEIMTIRPQAVMSLEDTSESLRGGELAEHPLPSGECIAAILDGYPIGDHLAIKDRISIVEIDVKAIDVPSLHRRHGTAMASLVVRGDLHSPGTPLTRNVAVVPVLASDARGYERIPSGKLPIGVIHRALEAIVGKAARPAKDAEALKKVVIINHSLCDTYAPFIRRPSPWAALLDHYSYAHRLLFVVSAGNITSEFPLPGYANLAALQAAKWEDRQIDVMQAVERSKGNRGMFSPAEAINAVTVGAIHAEEAPAPARGAAIDPYPDGRLRIPNLGSATGLGVNRSVKPDLIEHGGRFSLGCANVPGGGVTVHAKPAANMGQFVASPSKVGDLAATSRLAGTSNAAALVTRTCINIADSVDEAFRAGGVDWTTLATRAPIIRALLAHSCTWGETGEILDQMYPPANPRHSARRNTISRFVGFGQPRPDRIVSGAANRITLLAEDVLHHKELNEYKIPVPASMFRRNEIRRVTITMAYTAPVLTPLADYRGVQLQVIANDGTRDFWTHGADRILQSNADTVERGTLYHFELEGKSLPRLNNRISEFYIGVQAVSKHQSFNKVPVPYALAVTLEVAEQVNSTIYADVRARVRAPQHRALVKPRIQTRR